MKELKDFSFPRIKASHKAIISIVLILATFAAYEPVRKNGFVSYDDYKYIVDNPQITSGITWQSIGRAFTQPHFFMWHPLTTLSHMIDYEVFGLNPVGHHIVSLAIHIVNALLLFWILTNITGAIWPSAFVAAVFALHPLQVESVAWAAERKTVLSGLFWLLTMAVYIRYTRHPGLRRYMLLLLVYGLCIMTKPVVVTLPLALVVLDYWPLERIRGRKTEDGRQKLEDRSQKASAGWLIVEKIPLLVLSAILSVITFLAQHSGGVVTALDRIPLEYRVTNLFISYIQYIYKMIWPSKLAVFYPNPRASFLNTTVIVCVLIFVALWVYSIYTGRRKKYTASGWLWYVGTLVPVIGLVQAGLQAMANRYMYIPMLGLLIIIAWSIKDLVIHRPRWRIIAGVSAAVVLLSAAILTRMHVSHWQSSKTLFEYALKVTKNNEIAENSYGCALYRAGQFSEAEPHFRNAIQISPNYFDANFNLGKNLFQQGKLDEAVACFNEILRHKQDSADVYYCLAVALNGQKKYDEAIKYLIETLKLNPVYPDAHNKMGACLLIMGKTDEAIEYLNKAVRINPKGAEAYANLGTIYTQREDYKAAIRNWTKAVELQPDNASILNNLAWVLATVDKASGQDASKAIDFALRACKLTKYERPSFLDTLAVSYAAEGRFSEAIATAEQALNIAKTHGQDKLAGEIQNRIEMYKAGQPYREK